MTRLSAVNTGAKGKEGRAGPAGALGRGVAPGRGEKERREGELGRPGKRRRRKENWAGGDLGPEREKEGKEIFLSCFEI